MPLGRQIAAKRPDQPEDPNDPAYDWSQYDASIMNAAQTQDPGDLHRSGHPALGERRRRSANRAPKKGLDLQRFALRGGQALQRQLQAPRRARPLPAVRRWLAWNEPNSPVFLPAAVGAARKKRNIPFVAPGRATQICNGDLRRASTRRTSRRDRRPAAPPTRTATTRRGARRPSIAPLTFLAALHKYGLRQLRRLRPPSVLRKPEPGADDAPIRGTSSIRLGEPRPADEAADPALREQEPVDHRVRLPDQAAGQALRRHVFEAGQVPEAGVHDRAEEPADHADVLVPAPRRDAHLTAGSPA